MDGPCDRVAGYQSIRKARAETHSRRVLSIIENHSAFILSPNVYRKDYAKPWLDHIVSVRASSRLGSQRK